MLPVEPVSFLLDQVFPGEKLLQFSREKKKAFGIFLIADLLAQFSYLAIETTELVGHLDTE
jgi:hypothetical protein